MAAHNFADLTGQQFGDLVVRCRSTSIPGDRGRSRWVCTCVCGGFTVVAARHLRDGRIVSCGCRRQRTPARLRHGDGRRGAARTVEYNCWAAMHRRCYNPNVFAFEHYGGRGIKVCERWFKYENFLADMGRRPTPQHSIDRIDNDGDYTPQNCRWATKSEQRLNQRRRK